MIAIYHQRLAQIYNTTIYHTDFLNLPIDRLITQQLDMVFIDAMKAHYHLFLERILPYCKPWATIICDDVIAFADKVNPLFVTINEHSLAYKQIKLDDGDGLLVITV